MKGWRLVNKAKFVQPGPGYCNFCALIKLITHSAHVVERFKVVKLNLCLRCSRVVDRIPKA